MDMKKGFLELPRTDGRRAWIRGDSIMTLLENEERVGKGDEARTVLVTTVIMPNGAPINVALPFDTIRKMVSSAGALGMQVTTVADVCPPEPVLLVADDE